MRSPVKFAFAKFAVAGAVAVAPCVHASAAAVRGAQSSITMTVLRSVSVRLRRVIDSRTRDLWNEYC